MTQNSQMSKKMMDFVKRYSTMDINGVEINCPYWANKIKNKKVVLRGYLNGKGEASRIRNQLIKRLKILDYGYPKTSKFITKFARRERIGIDCSGFAYRFLDKLIKLTPGGNRALSMDKIFPQGINRTNVKKLTDSKYTRQVKKIEDINIGDFIRMMGGKHVVIVLEKREDEIIYVHSSNKSEKQGVHLDKILLKDKNLPIENQIWLEKTRKGKDFFKKYFHKNKGDGVKRLLLNW